MITRAICQLRRRKVSFGRLSGAPEIAKCPKLRRRSGQPQCPTERRNAFPSWCRAARRLAHRQSRRSRRTVPNHAFTIGVRLRPSSDSPSPCVRPDGESPRAHRVVRAAVGRIRPLLRDQFATPAENGIGRNNGHELSEQATSEAVPEDGETPRLSSLNRIRRPCSNARRTRFSSRTNFDGFALLPFQPAEQRRENQVDWNHSRSLCQGQSM